MRVIFLDIDGVLNCADQEDTARGLVRPRDDLIALLDDLIDRTAAQIVLASTWRCDPKVVEVARRCGLKFIDTLDEHGSGERGAFIRKVAVKASRGGELRRGGRPCQRARRPSTVQVQDRRRPYP